LCSMTKRHDKHFSALAVAGIFAEFSTRARRCFCTSMAQTWANVTENVSNWGGALLRALPCLPPLLHVGPLVG